MTVHKAPIVLILLLVLTTVAAVLWGRANPPPMSAERSKAERGRELYGRMCAVCHGAMGEGYRADEAPRLASPEYLAAVPDSFLRVTIENGRPGTTMSAWARARGGPLSRGDTEALIAFIRKWDKAPHPPLDEKPLAGDASRAPPVYARECVKCHGDKGVGGPNVHIGSPEFLANATNGYLRQAIRNGRPGTKMPGFAVPLGPEPIEDLITMFRSWVAKTPPAPLPVVKPPPIPLGPVPLNPKGPAPVGFEVYPKTTKADVIKAELDRGAKMGLLDARAPSDYMNEHIAGAVSVPFYDPSPYFSELPKDAWLVSYCSCPHAESKELAQKLMAAGFKHVTVLDEGLGHWKGKKYPTSKGEKP